MTQTLGSILAGLEARGATLRVDASGNVVLRGGQHLTPAERELLLANRPALAALVALRARQPKPKPRPKGDEKPEALSAEELAAMGRHRLRRTRLDRLRWARGILAYNAYLDDGGPVGADMLSGHAEGGSNGPPAAEPYVPVADRPATDRRRFGDSVDHSFRRSTR